MNEFNGQKLDIKKQLVNAQSRIHISFDGTSPNHRALYAVVPHFIDSDPHVRSLLIGLRRIRGAYTGENLAEVISPVLEEMEIIPNLGDYLATNDVAIRCIVKEATP